MFKFRKEVSNLQTVKKYTLAMFKNDLLAAFSCAAWTFPLALAFGVTSPFGVYAGIIGGIIACLIGANGKNKIIVPNLAIFLIILYAANSMGVGAAMISISLAGLIMVIISRFHLSRKLIRISPVAVGAISFAVAIVLCIIEVNFYFGIGIPQGTALFSLAAYKSFGFHANWRGVLFGTIALVIMITYPIKFKKFSKKVPEPFVALVLCLLLNIFLLNPEKTHTYIDEIGNISSNLIMSLDKINFSGLRKDNILQIVLFSTAIVCVYLVDTLAREKHPNDIRKSLLLKGVGSVISPAFGGVPTISEKRAFGSTRLVNLYSAIMIVLMTIVFFPVLDRVPVAPLGVIIIVIGWKSPSYKAMRKVLVASKHKLVSVAAMFALVFACVVWNIVYVIDIAAAVTFVYCIARYLIKNKKDK